MKFKKRTIILFLTVTLLLICFTSIIHAQNGKAAIDEIGGWVAINGYNSNYSLLDARGTGVPFPMIAEQGGKTTKPSPLMRDKLLQIRDLFVSAYPKPLGHSMLYDLKLSRQKSENDPLGMYLTINGHGLEYDGKGGLKKNQHRRISRRHKVCGRSA